MSSEREMRQQVISLLRPLHAVSIESGCGAGVPDINYADGWIECKQLPSWPVRPETPVRVPCFTPSQRVWLTKRRQAGGAAFLLLKVGTTWLLFDGAVAARHLSFVTKSDLFKIAIWFWESLGEDFLSTIRAHKPIPNDPNLNSEGAAWRLPGDRA